MRRSSLAFLFVCSLALAACDTAEPDVDAPTVRISAPAAGALLSGTVEVTIVTNEPATAVLRVDGSQVATSTDGSFQLDTSALADGPHEMTVQATDEAGNSRLSAPVMFQSFNSPTPVVTVRTPVTGDLVRGTAVIQYETLSVSDIVEATLLVDGEAVATGNAGRFQLDTLPFPDGTYDVAVRVEDAEGDVGTSEAASIEFQNDAQSVGLTFMRLVAAPFTRPNGAPWDVGFMEAPDFHLSLKYPGGEVIWSNTVMDVQPSDLPLQESASSPIQLPLGAEFFGRLYEADDFFNSEVASESETVVLDQVREQPSVIRLESADGRFVAEYGLAWSYDPPRVAAPRSGQPVARLR